MGLDAAVMNALERNPAHRTQTAADFAEQLEQVIQSSAGETVEAWAARELAKARDDHREWLASIVAGVSLPRAIGRATGQVTEVGPRAGVKTELAPARDPIPAVAPIVRDTASGSAPPMSPTSIGREADGDSDEGLSIPPKSKLGPLVLVLLALLVVGGGVFFVLSSKTSSAITRDAAVIDDAIVETPPPPADATTIQVDAQVTLAPDAGTKTVLRTKPDAGVAKIPDAGVVPTATADAAIAAPPAGSGFVTILFKPGLYANISIDDAPAIPGPIFKKKLVAGRHTIKFLDPKSGDVLDTQTIDITDGNLTTVKQH
jgi:hypothetical protein